MSGDGVVEGDLADGPLVYLVDDDEGFREEMVFGLSKLGLNVLGFESAAALYRAYAAKPSDILVIDIGLHGEDGLSIASHLRSSPNTGIILATARGSVDDRVNGLKKGADAYLVKPIDVRELAATVVAVNERLDRKPTVSGPLTPEWALAEGGWILTDGIGNRLRLTTPEQRFLGRLFIERGSTVERSALVKALGVDVYDFNYTHLDTIVSRLRRRAKKRNMILPLHAVRGVGFVFTD